MLRDPLRNLCLLQKALHLLGIHRRCINLLNGMLSVEVYNVSSLDLMLLLLSWLCLKFLALFAVHLKGLTLASYSYSMKSSLR